MQTAHEMRFRILGKAASDPDYRARLIDDPRGAVAHELGVSVPDSLSVHVHEEGPAVAHLVLPPRSELGPGELQAATGGIAAWAGGPEW